MNRLKDRAAIVTGAARGIGRAIAKRAASEGASVLMVDILEEVLKSTALDFEENGYRVQPLTVDLTSEDAPRQFREAALNQYGRIDIVANNAAIPLLGRAEDVSPEQFREIVAVNLDAPFRILREILPVMSAQGSGRVINFSSMAAQAR